VEVTRTPHKRGGGGKEKRLHLREEIENLSSCVKRATYLKANAYEEEMRLGRWAKPKPQIREGKRKFQ